MLTMSSLLSLLRSADFLVTFGVNAVVLYFSFVAYRRTKMRAFAFWIWSAGIALIQTMALHTYGSSRSTLSHSDAETFQVFYRTFYIVGTVLGTLGTVMLVRYMLAGLQKDDESCGKGKEDVSSRFVPALGVRRRCLSGNFLIGETIAACR